MALPIRVRLQVDSLRARLHHRRVAHFLHPGKTAGTAMKAALRRSPEPVNYAVRLQTHGVRMVDIPRGDKFFFVVRDPVDRFISGFYSRQRQGRPRHDRPWSEGEARAFARFSSAQDLADALGSDARDRADAADALRTIDHVRTSYWDWFGDPAKFRRRWPDVLFIGFQENLDDQLPVLAERLGLDELVLPKDDVGGHRTTGIPDTPLTAEGRQAMAEWYERDYEFVALCRELVARV